MPSINFVGWKSLVSSHDTTDQAWYIYPSVYVYSVYPMMGFDGLIGGNSVNRCIESTSVTQTRHNRLNID